MSPMHRREGGQGAHIGPEGGLGPLLQLGPISHQVGVKLLLGRDRRRQLAGARQPGIQRKGAACEAQSHLHCHASSRATRLRDKHRHSLMVMYCQSGMIFFSALQYIHQVGVKVCQFGREELTFSIVICSQHHKDIPAQDHRCRLRKQTEHEIPGSMQALEHQSSSSGAMWVRQGLLYEGHQCECPENHARGSHDVLVSWWL